MPITRHSLPADLEEGLNAHFGRAYKEHPEEWSRFLDTETSNKAFEEDVLQSGFGSAPRKPEGQGIAYDTTQEVWTARYTHDTYALAFAITEEALEDNLYERQAPKNAKGLARAMRSTKEIKAAAILNNAFDSAFTGGDGIELCATNHPTLMAGDQSNELATPADFSEASLEDILIQISIAKDDRGIPIQMNAKKVIIPPQLVFECQRVLGAMYRSGTADNDPNAIKDLGILAASDCVKVTRLTDPDAWFVKTDCPEGLKHIKRINLQRGMDTDFNTGNTLYKARERYSQGWSDWRSIYGSAGA